MSNNIIVTLTGLREQKDRLEVKCAQQYNSNIDWAQGAEGQAGSMSNNIIVTLTGLREQKDRLEV